MTPPSSQQPSPPIDTKDPTTELGFYFQDDWKVRRNFTLSLGVRYDREFGALNEFLNPSSLAGLPYNAIVPIPGMGDPGQAQLEQKLRPALRLRLGRPRQRQGCGPRGLRHLLSNLQTLQNFAELRNYAQCSVLINSPAYPDPFGGQAWQTFCSHAAPSPTILDPNYRNPYTQQFNLGYSRELTHDFSIHFDGAYSHSLHDYRTVDLNYPVNGVRPYPQFARILDHSAIGAAKYEALYVRAEKRFAQRYQFMVSYSLASNKDNNPEAQVTVPSNYGLDWGPANADRRHNLIASTSVQLPWRFTLGAFWTLRSSLPFSAIEAVTDADGIHPYVPGTSRNQGNRDLSLAAVNAYRATLGLAPLTASNIDSSRYNGVDVKLSRAFALKSEKRRIGARPAGIRRVRNREPGRAQRPDDRRRQHHHRHFAELRPDSRSAEQQLPAGGVIRAVRVLAAATRFQSCGAVSEPRPRFRAATPFQSRDPVSEPRPRFRAATPFQSRGPVSEPRPRFRAATPFQSCGPISEPRPPFQSRDRRERCGG